MFKCFCGYFIHMCLSELQGGKEFKIFHVLSANDGRLIALLDAYLVIRYSDRRKIMVIRKSARFIDGRSRFTILFYQMQLE